MRDQPNSFIDNTYISRLNKTIDYIEINFQKQFTLEELASVANFSKFHFNRIFKAFMGETPFQFINRLRLEKVASLLLLNKKQSIGELANNVGFTDITVFSRYFKSYFKMSASEYRIKKSNIGKEVSNMNQPDYKAKMYFSIDSKTYKWTTNMKTNKSVEVKNLEKMTVAYVRHIGAYKGNDQLFEQLWGRLCSWAGPRGLMGNPNSKFLAVYHDDPNITSEEKLRMSICITVPNEYKVDGEIGKMELEGGKYVVARFELDKDGFTEAWDWVYSQWLPSSGYLPDDKPCFEIYPEDPKDGKFVVDICVPIIAY